MDESDPRSNVLYLSSSENKAWKKFRPVRVFFYLSVYFLFLNFYLFIIF